MLRLTHETPNARTTTLRLEGRLVAGWGTLVARHCEALLQQVETVDLDLSGVSHVDREGVRVLQGLVSPRVRIANCPPLIKELLEERES